MDLIDFFWNLSQDDAISELKTSHSRAKGSDAAMIKRLQDENYEIRLRVSLLMRLLIERGIFSAADFSTLLDETKANLTTAKRSRAERSGPGVKVPAALRPPAGPRKSRVRSGER